MTFGLLQKAGNIVDLNIPPPFFVEKKKKVIKLENFKEKAVFNPM